MEIDPVAAASAALIAQSFLSEAGRSAWEGMSRMVAAVRTRLGGDEAGESALMQIQQNPQDSHTVSLMALRIDAAMAVDEDFRETMKHLIEEAQANSSTATTVTRAYHDYRSAHIEKVVNVETVQGDLNF